MKSEYFTVEILERSKGNWRHIKSLEDGGNLPKRYAQRLYDYIEENKYLILEHNKQEGNGFGFDADELV